MKAKTRTVVVSLELSQEEVETLGDVCELARVLIDERAARAVSRDHAVQAANLGLLTSELTDIKHFLAKVFALDE